MPKRSRPTGSSPGSSADATPETTSAQPAVPATPPKEAVSDKLANALAKQQDMIADLTDMLNRQGRHADHSQEQLGRCVYCSCGLRAQGKLARPNA